MSERFIDNKSFPKVMRKVARALLPYSWCMIGGRSVEVWANPPQTPDIDFLVKFKAKDANRVITAMQDEGFVLLKKFFDKDYIPMFFFKDEAEDVEVDLVGAFEDVQEWAIDRAVAKTIGGVKFLVAQAEDVVILKANAAVSPRRGDKIVRDKAAIRALAQDVELDTDYIEIVLSQAMADWSDERSLLVKLGILEK